jgi:hypothetical protein
MANEQNLKPFTGADDPRRMNGKPKGTVHLSTHIQNMLNDPEFELKLKDGSLLKGAPIIAIIKTAVAKSVSGDTRAMEWLAKHGYGDKLVLEINDPRKEILDKYLGGDSAGQTKEA